MPATKEHMDAIRPLGHRTRRERARVRTQLDQRQVGFFQILNGPPPAMARLSVERALLMVRGLGPRKATHILSKAGVSRTRPLGRLTEHERRRLAGAMRAHVPIVYRRAGGSLNTSPGRCALCDGPLFGKQEKYCSRRCRKLFGLAGGKGAEAAA